jgi:hypothetical protein
MKRALSISLAVSVVCALLAAAGPTPALAGAPHGTLTKTEYRDINSWLVEETKAFGKKGTLKEAATACKDLGNSTAFMKSMQRSCDNQLVLLITVAESGLLQETCDKSVQTTTTTTTTPTTTTPTTTNTTTTSTVTGTTPTVTTASGTTTGTSTTPSVNGLTSTQVQVFACMKRVYAALNSATAAQYKQDAITRRDGVSRGLKGACLNTMVATTKQLTDEKNMASSAKRLLAGSEQLVKVLAGQVSASSVNGYAINTAEYDFNKAYTALGDDSTPNKLSTCPHQ